MLKTRHNPTYGLTSHDIPKGEVSRKKKVNGKTHRDVVWEETEIHGKPKIAVVCINSNCRKINIIDKSEVKSSGFVDRGRWENDYDKSCIACECGVCYWPYLVGWKPAEKKTRRS
jgi:hypothetical protein